MEAIFSGILVVITEHEYNDKIDTRRERSYNGMGAG